MFDFLKKFKKNNEPSKCPYCGQLLTENDLKCPSCGRDIRSKNTISAMDQFMSQVNALSSEIKSPTVPRKGFASWNKGGRVWWIILNVCTIGIPYLFYDLKQQTSAYDIMNMSKEEENLANYIRNFQVPDNASDHFEIMHYLNAKTQEVGEGLHRRSFPWIKVFYSKATDMRDRLIALGTQDPLIEKEYMDIEKVYLASQKKQKERVFFSAFLLLIIVAAIVLYYMFGPKTEVTQ